MLVLAVATIAFVAMATAAAWSRSRAAFLTSLLMAATATVLAVGTAADLAGEGAGAVLRLVVPLAVLALAGAFSCMVWWVRRRIDTAIADEHATPAGGEPPDTDRRP